MGLLIFLGTGFVMFGVLPLIFCYLTHTVQYAIMYLTLNYERIAQMNANIRKQVRRKEREYNRIYFQQVNKERQEVNYFINKYLNRR